MKSLHDEYLIAKHLVYDRDDLTVCVDDLNYIVQEFGDNIIILTKTELAYLNFAINGPVDMPAPPKPLWSVTLFGFTLSVGRAQP